MLRWWHRQPLQDGQGLPADLSSLFAELCDTKIERFRHARVLLAAHVITLFRVDHEWATQHLLPLLEWQRSEVEARAAWEGFFWSPHLYRPLIEAIKKPFLDTARHYAALGKHGDQYAELLTFAALDAGETFTKVELADATRSLPSDGLHSAAQALVRALEGAGEQRAEYWKNRVVPYLQSIWPKSRDRVTPGISESLGSLCIAAREVFPDAVMLLRHWLQPPEYPDYLVHRLHEEDLCRRFPETTLEFLDLLVRDGTPGLGIDLAPCLDALREADPKLESDGRFQRLWEYLRRYGFA